MYIGLLNPSTNSILIFEKAPFLPKNIVESKNEKKQDRDAVKKLKNCRVHSSSKQSQITA